MDGVEPQANSVLSGSGCHSYPLDLVTQGW
jgi:hypothetical protein